MSRGVLLFQSLDQPGIVATISDFMFEKGGNIVSLDQYSTDPQGGYFFLRMEVSFEKEVHFESLRQAIAVIAKKFEGSWHWNDLEKLPNVGILVSKQGHCLVDLLYHFANKELSVNVAFIVSNHPDHEALANHYKIPYYHLPVTSDDKKEKEILEIVKSKTDFLVLARYMQILSKGFLADYAKPVINIHHSFLPSFIGANPYAQAYHRGVKLIGATAHYVTENLDEGPIIEQAVERVSHRDSQKSLRTKGKRLEQLALFRAVTLHSQHKIISHKNKTIVFN
jgi:formyltetrahydrofolate deformylase